MQQLQEFCRNLAVAVRTQLNTAHVQLNKKLRMGDFLSILTFSERRMFLKNHAVEFHTIRQGDTSDSGQVKD